MIGTEALCCYGAGMSLLYIEDDAAVRQPTAELLALFFETVETAADGAEGLRRYCRRLEGDEMPFDVVLSDIVMPGMDGIELSKAIRTVSEEQLIVITSAYDLPENLIRLINIGIDGFLGKPLKRGTLYRELSRIMKTAHRRKRSVTYDRSNRCVPGGMAERTEFADFEFEFKLEDPKIPLP